MVILRNRGRMSNDPNGTVVRMCSIEMIIDGAISSFWHVFESIELNFV